MSILRFGPFLLALVACKPADDPLDTDVDDTDDTAGLPLVFQYSFAIVADPHITGSTANTERLTAALDWIDANAEDRTIELVFVLGDIAWGSGLPTIRGLLHKLTVPYIPIIGDNVIQSGYEEDYYDTFADHYALLGTQLDGFDYTDGSVFNPEHQKDSWFQNSSFQYKGLHFIDLDWCTRIIGGIEGEAADLHDFDGGTWPWFEAYLTDLPSGTLEESVNLMTHHPMHWSPGGFNDEEEMAAITELTSSLGQYVAGNYAGHYHVDWDFAVEEGGYDVFATDATWDDTNRVRIVEVWGDGEHFEYVQELVDVP
ncbi:MAG: hypothetical protein HN348_23655 [Proteobacteria bacterium]|nr:hypothetical protein [Pseudomonadota bacterium]